MCLCALLYLHFYDYEKLELFQFMSLITHCDKKLQFAHFTAGFKVSSLSGADMPLIVDGASVTDTHFA